MRRALPLLLVLVAGVLAGAPAAAHDGKGTALPAEALRELVKQLPRRSDVVSWAQLANVKTRVEGDHAVADFDRRVLVLKGKRQRLQGYMLPLDGGANQRHFLLSATPNSCPGTPETMVYVRLDKPVEFRRGVIVVQGKFDVALNDETGMYYRMSEAHLVR